MRRVSKWYTQNKTQRKVSRGGNRNKEQQQQKRYDIDTT